MLVLLQVPVEMKNAPITLGLIVALLVGLMTAVGFYFTWRTFAMRKAEFEAKTAAQQVEDDEAQQKNLEELISRICREITTSEGFKLRQERDMSKMAADTVAEEMRTRSTSFVSTKAYEAQHADALARVAAVEGAVYAMQTNLRGEFDKLANRFDAAVAKIEKVTT